MAVNDDSPLTYEQYLCMMSAHGCECLALTPAEWAALPTEAPS